jgi:RNA polymerase sigma-54 factor
MEFKQQLRLTQQLVMTPQLQQAIKLLQMSRMELVDLVREEMLENPMLEDVAEVGSTEREAPKDVAVVEASTIDKAGAADDKAADAAKDKKTEDFDWERYLENHAMQAPVPSFRGGGGDDELPGIEATYSRAEDLTEHLVREVRMANFMPDEQRFLGLVIGNLTDDGFLELDDVPEDEIVEKLAREAELDAEDAEEVLKMFQKLDPLGVGSRSLEECLRVQAEHHGMDELVLKVISDHLSNLEKKNYQGIARDLDVPVEEIYDVADVIAELEPRPARNFISEEPRYIVPDVHVHKIADKYFVVANDDGMPKLKISGFYRSAMADNKEAKEYIQNKLRSAQWLIRSIDQRRKTIVKVTECIVRKQQDFFDKGIEHLKPMILRDVAEDVEMHESTISRVTSNKYVNTPRGLFELKYFFNSAIQQGHSEIASESVKQAIDKIIAAEDKKKPYSDQKIAEILKAKKNITIARRTVAKYREGLGILSSSQRKKYF